MDRDIAKALEKLAKAVGVIGQDVVQLKLDLAKLDARMGAIDGQVTGISRRLDHSPRKEADEGRDLDLEREVFGAFRPGRGSPKGQKQQARKIAVKTKKSPKRPTRRR
jgi:hypothetical protein